MIDCKCKKCHCDCHCDSECESCPNDVCVSCECECCE